MSNYFIGNGVVWVQSTEEGDTSLEVTIPVVLPAGVRTKELSVLVKDQDVLCIKYKESTLVQWRLYSRVSEDVEWRAENSNVVVDLVKAEGATWPCLLNLPMRPDDPLLSTTAELDVLFAKEVKPLPPVKTAPAADEAKADAIDEEDLDRMLDETVQEVQELDMYVKAELKGMEEEESEMKAKLQELEESLTTAEDDETKETTKKQILLIERMIEIHNKTRELRSHVCTVETFLETQALDLRKSRINVGELNENETEAFLNDEERGMSAVELFAVGVRALQEQQVDQSLHFLRLAAVHHKHSQSISVLFRLYSELGSPRGAYILLQRAKEDDDALDVTSNLQVAEMFDRGARHFPPILGAAIYFYQRAARCGSVHAMIGLAQLFLRGSTTATTLNEEEREANIDKKKYHAWLEQAIGRGSGAALFIKGCMHLRGEHGCEKSYRVAKDYLERSGKCQPEIIKRSAGVNAALEKLRIEEDAASGNTTELGSPASPPTPPSSPTRGLTTVPQRNAPKVDVAARLAALDSQSTPLSPADGARKPAKKAGGSHAAASARSRAFWERATVTGTAVYVVYTLAFPIRVLLLPQFYTAIQWFLDMFGFGGGSSGMDARGLMM
jgi:hypothetical protein